MVRYLCWNYFDLYHELWSGVSLSLPVLEEFVQTTTARISCKVVIECQWRAHTQDLPSASHISQAAICMHFKKDPKKTVEEEEPLMEGEEEAA